MADYVNIQQDELNSILENLIKVHEVCEENIADYLAGIQKLSETDGGFYIEKISERIELLLETLNRDALGILKEAFQDTETVIQDNITELKRLDTVQYFS